MAIRDKLQERGRGSAEETNKTEKKRGKKGKKERKKRKEKERRADSGRYDAMRSLPREVRGRRTVSPVANRNWQMPQLARKWEVEKISMSSQVRCRWQVAGNRTVREGCPALSRRGRPSVGRASWVRVLDCSGRVCRGGTGRLGAAPSVSQCFSSPWWNRRFAPRPRSKTAKTPKTPL